MDPRPGPRDLPHASVPGVPRRDRLAGAERLDAEGEAIVRIETLGGELLYAIRIRLVDGGFSLCPADYCELPGTADGVSGRGLPIDPFVDLDFVLEQARERPRPIATVA